jgi:hypothetical protein
MNEKLIDSKERFSTNTRASTCVNVNKLPPSESETEIPMHKLNSMRDSQFNLIKLLHLLKLEIILREQKRKQINAHHQQIFHLIQLFSASFVV